MTRENDLLYYLTCFTTGFAILVFELLSFRMLSPYFGNSSIVIGTIINSILLALSLGYYLGGYIADKKKSSKLIYYVIISSSAYMFLVYLTYPILLKSIAKIPVIAGSLLAIIMLFFLPMILLSFVPPYLIKVISSKDNIGVSSGKIFSISTLGSIMGGIFTTFFLIPYAGTKESILLTSVLLFLLGCAGLKSVKLMPVPAAFLLLAPYGLSAGYDLDIIYEDESVYNIIAVEEYDGNNYLKLNDLAGHHSVSINKKTCLAGTYTDMHLFPHIFIDAEKTLILGNGAGNIMEQVSCFSGTSIDGVEIDREITQVGKEYFGLTLNGKKKVYHEDARVFLQKSQTRYDVIHVDLFAGNPYIPFHLSTVEFFQQIHDALEDQGAMVVNYPKFLAKDKELSDFYLGTIAQVFPTTFLSDEALFSFKTDISAQQVMDQVSSRQPSGSLFIVARDALAKFEKIEPGSKSFTDDYAPIEMLTYKALKR
ncbi:MAG: fused MFS/spermidine synthase [Desulfobulbaceae bacterium]|nr:fused MFS/spermidine synthase [Desulfobulbaceae bacterium]